MEYDEDSDHRKKLTFYFQYTNIKIISNELSAKMNWKIKSILFLET